MFQIPEFLQGLFSKLLSLVSEWKRVKCCFLLRIQPDMKANISHPNKKFSTVLQHVEYALTLASICKSHLSEALEVLQPTFPLGLTWQSSRKD